MHPWRTLPSLLLSPALLLAACSKKADTDTPDGGTDGPPQVVSTADTAEEEEVNPFDATNLAFEFDGILLADGTLGGYWTSDTEHEMPQDWNPPRIEVRFADEVLFDEITDSEEDVAAHTCSVWAEYVSVVEEDLVNDNEAPLYHAYEGYLDMFYYDLNGQNQTFTDCNAELDPDTWGQEGRDLWPVFDGARFGLGFGHIGETDLKAYWGADYETYKDSMIASYVAVNRLDDDGELEYLGDAQASCLLFQYDPVTEELVDIDDDNELEFVDISGQPDGVPLPESYVRCFAYWWPAISGFDFTRLDEGANGEPDRSDTGT